MIGSHLAVGRHVHRVGGVGHALLHRDWSSVVTSAAFPGWSCTSHRIGHTRRAWLSGSGAIRFHQR
jgi:hypothetical protein